MAQEIHVAGPVHIRISAPVASGQPTLESLGYSEAGVDITETQSLLNVQGDQNGGDAGEPIDEQYMGETHTIRMTLTKWDEAVVNKIRARIAAGTAGTVPRIGTLLRQGGHTFRLQLDAPFEPRDYAVVIFREPQEINKGSKHSKLVLVATSRHPVGGGSLYTATTTTTTTAAP